MTIQVIKPGALSTIQDLGRVGYQHLGVVVGGAMDPWSHRMANLLVGNDEQEATLEVTLMGPSLKFDVTTLLAICGADLAPRIGDTALPMGRPVLVRGGSQIDFGRRRTGARAYLAVRGGYQVAPVLHSKSTYVRGAFGGLDGRALRKGDEIATGACNPDDCYPQLARALSESAAPFVAHPAALVAPHADSALQIVRVIAGQQWDAYTEEAQAQLVGGDFRIGVQSDRMGYRLEGQTLALRSPLEMISEAVCFGTIQVPPDGDAIILMADRQTTGGYPKIASVISVDLPLLAQMMPHQALGFTLVTLDEAQQLYLAREQEASRIRQSIEQIKREA
jgi:biotin-dependent carboxylase-like uncharacterized protein